MYILHIIGVLSYVLYIASFSFMVMYLEITIL